MIMNGGEYNTNCQDDHTTKGALYIAKTNKWVNVNPPSGWSTIGDAVSIVLQSGTYMLSNCCNTKRKISKNKVTWTATGSGKHDDNNEEGWTLLPTGSVLAVDVWGASNANSDAELYNPGSGTWSLTGTTTNVMEDPVRGNSDRRSSCQTIPFSRLAPTRAPPRPARRIRLSTTYRPVVDRPGPDELKVGTTFETTEDAPGVVLPDGNVLSMESPGYSCGSAFCSPSHFFEYDGTSWTQVSDPVSGQAASDAAYEGRFLPLPTGQVLWTSDNGDVEVYTRQAAQILPAFRAGSQRSDHAYHRRGGHSFPARSWKA